MYSLNMFLRKILTKYINNTFIVRDEYYPPRPPSPCCKVKGSKLVNVESKLFVRLEAYLWGLENTWKLERATSYLA